MVRSKLNPDINYREYKQLERDDADYDATMYEIELLGKEVRIAIGRGKTDKKGIIYYPMYLINTDDRVVKQIGVFEIRAEQVSDVLDDDDDLDTGLAQGGQRSPGSQHQKPCRQDARCAQPVAVHAGQGPDREGLSGQAPVVHDGQGDGVEPSSGVVAGSHSPEIHWTCRRKTRKVRGRKNASGGHPVIEPSRRVLAR